jgi:hypothetical protein
MSPTFRTISDSPTHDSKMSVPMMLPAVAEMLNLLHKLGRGGLFSSGKQQTTKLCTYFITDLV